MSELGPEVLKIDEFSGREDALELDPARLAPGAAMPAQFVRNLFTDDTGGSSPVSGAAARAPGTFRTRR